MYKPTQLIQPDTIIMNIAIKMYRLEMWVPQDIIFQIEQTG